MLLDVIVSGKEKKSTQKLSWKRFWRQNYSPWKVKRRI